MNEFKQEVTAEEIARQYSAALDSVTLITSLSKKSKLSSMEQKSLEANVEHLKIMLAKPFWTNEDLTPLQEAAGVVAEVTE